MITFQIEIKNNIQILSIEGRLEPDDWKALKNEIAQLLEDEKKDCLLIDLEGLFYMASAGFREFFLAGRTLERRNGKLVVCGLQRDVKRIFEIARFDTAYSVFDDRESALDYLAK